MINTGKPKLSSRNTGQGPSAGTWLALPDVILPTSFKLGSLPVARECIPKHSCLPAQAPGCWELAVTFMELMCVSGCARLLKRFDENAFVLKSSINTESRPGRGLSSILPASAVIKGSGLRENGNGGDSPGQ